jgi:nocturnin
LSLALSAVGVTRNFQQVKPITINTKSALIRVLQFNTLADGLSGLRPDDERTQIRPSPFSLSWEHRKSLLINEIGRYDADVVSLQEVDHYYDFFLPELRKLGYDGLYAPKPISTCMEVSNNCDGCAIFIKRNKLRIISSEVNIHNNCTIQQPYSKKNML